MLKSHDPANKDRFAATLRTLRLMLGLLLLIVSLSCAREKVVSSCTDETGIYTYAAYPIGTAIDYEALRNDSTYRNLAIRQFNSFTPENIFKAEYLHPAEGVFHWTEADSFVNFCLANNKRLHGHTLVWHNQLPAWMSNYRGTAAEWEQLLKVHIQTIVSHFNQSVTAWDVVNEAFNEDGTLRNSIWKQKIGPGYIEKAFRFAQEANPHALLFYNDYNLESNPVKRKSVLALLNTLKSRGISVHGIGVQMHISTTYPEPSQIAEAFQEITSNHYLLHVSEFDIAVNPQGKTLSSGTSFFSAQAQRLGSVVSHYNQVAKRYQYGITFWGISDKNSWIRSFYNRQDYPLLFDDMYLPKPAYCTLIQTL